MVLEAVVRDNGAVHLAGKGKDEIVGVGPGGRLADMAIVDELLVAGGVIDLVPNTASTSTIGS